MSKFYLTYKFNIQNNRIFIIAEEVGNIRLIATKNKIVKKAMELFNTNTNIDMSKISKEDIKETKKHIYNSITIEAKSLIDLDIKNLNYSVIELDPTLKEAKEEFTIKVKLNNGDIIGQKVIKYNTKIKEFKNNFDLCIHKDDNYYYISDIISGALLIKCKYKKDIEFYLEKLLELNGIEKLINARKEFIKNHNLNAEEIKECNQVENIESNIEEIEPTEEIDQDNNINIEEVEQKEELKESNDILKNEVLSIEEKEQKENKIKTNNIKIKLLDNKINRLMDQSFIIKKMIDNKGIKWNDRENLLLKQYEALNDKMDLLDDRINIIRDENNNIYHELFKSNLNALYNEYNNKKYKVINNIDNSIIYTNNIKDYLYNENYTIKLILDNKEIYKQGYNINCAGANWLDKNTFQVIHYKNNDAINIVEKLEVFSNNILIHKTIHKIKRNNSFVYSYIKDLNETILFNSNMIKIDDIQTIKDLFYNDIEIIDIIDNYKIPEVIEKKEEKISLLDVAIKDYEKIVNRFKELKNVCDNIEYYNSIYKNNLKDFYKKYKTNSNNFANYLSNYRYLKYLLENKNTLENYKYKAPLKVVYTTKYRK